MADRIQQRRDTAARWSQYNPILLEGEVGYVTDNPNQYKIGDGVHTWNELPFRGFDGTVTQEPGDAEDAVMSQNAVTKEIQKISKTFHLEQSKFSSFSWQEGKAANVETGEIVNAEGWKCAEVDLANVSALLLPVPKSSYGSGICFYAKNGSLVGNYYNSTLDEGTLQVIEVPFGTSYMVYSVGTAVNVTEITLLYFSFLGGYEDNSFMRVYTDSEGHFLFGINNDGSIEWAKGIPQPIRKELLKLSAQSQEFAGKISEIESKTTSFENSEDDDFCFIIKDSENRILFGLDKNGKPYYPNNTLIENSEDDDFVYLVTDSNNKVVWGIKKDGSIFPEYTNDAITIRIISLEQSVSSVTKRVDVISSLYGTDNMSEISGWVSGSIIAIGNVGIGGTISYVPETLGGYRHAIVECSAGDTFLISGTGGNNPRLYAFVDASDKILTMSESMANYTHKTVYAPQGAAKLIINDSSNRASFKGIDNITPNILGEEGSSILYETPDDTVSAFVNGIKFADELKAPLTDFKKDGDKMVHVSTFYIINGVIYVTYYVNTRSRAENPAEHTARFVYCNQSSMEQKTYIDLCDVGDTVLGKTVTALYDIVMFKKTDDDDVLYLAWTVALDGEYYRVYRTYTISTGTLGDIQANTFTVGSVTNDFSISGMKGAMDANGITYKNPSGDIGLMQKLSTRVEGSDTYYYTGCYVGPFNCILKSKDLINWIYVSQPTFENDSQWENAVYVLWNKVYYFCRQYTYRNVAFLATYNLETGEWSEPVWVYEAQSRYDFFMYQGSLYAIHSPKDRNHLAIMKIDTNNLVLSYDVQVGYVPDYFYPFVQVYGNDLYVSYTASRQHIYLAKFTLKAVALDEVIDKFRTMFFNN